MGLISRLRESVYSLEKTVAALRQVKSEALITNLSCRVILRMWSCVRQLRVTGIDRCARDQCSRVRLHLLAGRGDRLTLRVTATRPMAGANGIWSGPTG